MIRFVVVRIFQALPVILAVITATFFLIRMAPGGPFDSEKAVMPEVKAALEAQYKLDRPILDQYFSYLTDLGEGDFGPQCRGSNFCMLGIGANDSHPYPGESPCGPESG